MVALPCWRKPRLYILSKDWNQRWNDAGFYPAFKLHSKLFKLVIRILATLGFLSSKKADYHPNIQNLKTHSPFDRLSILVGTSGPTQKLIVRCLDENGNDVAYIKYGERSLSQQKLANERKVLEHLISGLKTNAGQIAPQILWYGEFGEGVALMISAVEGEMIPINFPKASDVSQRWSEISAYLEQLKSSEKTYPIDEHPAIGRLSEQLIMPCPQSAVLGCGHLEEYLKPLRERSWSIVIQHGDFAPWNIFSCPDGALCVVDWEEGNAVGFPGFDMIYYILQTAYLIHKWNATRTFDYARAVVCSSLKMDEEMADSMIRLTALDAYFRYSDRFEDKADALQQFRLAIINHENEN